MIGLAHGLLAQGWEGGSLYLGSTRKLDAEAAMQKARKMEAEALEINHPMPN